MSIEKTISRIAKSLGEVGETPLAQIAGVVHALGERDAAALLTETLQIETDGGMLVPDGTRRRTAGGVFFQLARAKLSHEQRRNVFFKPTQAPPADVESSPPPSSASIPPPPSSRLRKRVIEMVPQPAAGPPLVAGPVAAKAIAFSPPTGGSSPPPPEPIRAKVRREVIQAIAPLSNEEQCRLLLDLLAEIHDRAAGKGDARSKERAVAAGRAPLRD
jgi:PHAX RNA-binding domain